MRIRVKLFTPLDKLYKEKTKSRETVGAIGRKLCVICMIVGPSASTLTNALSTDRGRDYREALQLAGDARYFEAKKEGVLTQWQTCSMVNQL